MENLVIEFSKDWKGALKTIHKDVMTFFSSFRVGSEILKKVYTQLVLYYTRFTNITSLCYSAPPFRRDLVSLQVILYEIRTNYIKDI